MSSFLISIIGFVIEFRIILILRREKIVNVSEFWRILILMIGFLILNQNFSPKTSLMSNFIFIFLLLIFSISKKRLKKARVNQEILIFLDKLVLSMRSGRSFRESIANHQCDDIEIQKEVQSIFETLTLKGTYTNRIRAWRDLYTNLKEIDEAQFRVIDRLVSYRYRVRTQEDFRQKSRQVTLQSKMQSAVLSVIYVLTLIYVIRQFGWIENQKIIIISMLFFSMGHLCIHLIGKGLKWKV